LHKELLELDEGLDGLEAYLLDGLAHARNHVDFHCHVNHHLQMEHALAQNCRETLREDRVADIFVLHNVAEDEEQWLHVQVFQVARLHLGHELVDLFVVSEFFDHGDLVFGLHADCLKLVTRRQNERHVLGQQILVDLGAVNPLVLYQYAVFILRRGVSKVDVEEAGDDNEQDEEGAEEDGDLVFFLQEEARQGDCNIVVAWAVGVAVLFEIFIRGLVSKDLGKGAKA